MISYLEVDHIIQIHDQALKRYGGLPGLRDAGLLHSCIEYPKMNLFGAETFPTVFSKAGAYLFYLAKFHVFNDGNKRTASAASIIFLRLHGEQIPFSGKDMELFVIGVAEGTIPQKEIPLFLQSGQLTTRLR